MISERASRIRSAQHGSDMILQAHRSVTRSSDSMSKERIQEQPGIPDWPPLMMRTLLCFPRCSAELSKPHHCLFSVSGIHHKLPGYPSIRFPRRLVVPGTATTAQKVPGETCSVTRAHAISGIPLPSDPLLTREEDARREGPGNAHGKPAASTCTDRRDSTW